MLLFLHLDPKPREQVSIFDQLKRLDPLGLLFFVPSMVCLIVALQWGGSTYPWSAPKMIGLLVTFAVTIVIFIFVEFWTPETAMAPTRVVLNRSVGGAMVFMFLLSGALMSIIYYLTIWFQAVQGQSAVESGIRTFPLLISFSVFSVVVAVLTQKIGYYAPAMLVSPLLCAVGAGMLSSLTPSAPDSHWIGYQLLFGFGIGAGFQTSNLAPQTVLARDDVPIGMAMMFFMQQIGGAIFLAVGQNIFSSKLVDRLSGIAGLDTKAIIDTGATAIRKLVPPSELNAVIDAYSYALTRVFIVAAAISACMILGALAVEWKSIKKESTSGSKDAEAVHEMAKVEVEKRRSEDRDSETLDEGEQGHKEN